MKQACPQLKELIQDLKLKMKVDLARGKQRD